MARKGKVIWECVKVVPVENPGSDDLVTSRTYHYAMRADGKLLKKLTVVFKPAVFDNGKPRHHDYGWKLAGKPKDAVLTPEGARKTLEPKGYVFHD